MTKKAFQNLVTNIVAVLNNYLMIAKQSGRITIVLDAEQGKVIRCAVGNTLEINIKDLEKEDA